LQLRRNIGKFANHVGCAVGTHANIECRRGRGDNVALRPP
jgi:hypothetical protein